MRAAVAFVGRKSAHGAIGQDDDKKAKTMGSQQRAAAHQSTILNSTRAALAACVCLVAAGQAFAQAVTPKPASSSAAAADKKNPEVALKAYSAGTRAFETGKMADAVTQLSSALSMGGLPSNQMAKALYYRGAAYRKQGKPAMAISDLTSALWLKGGLGDQDRALATDARAAAYREAGLGESAPAVPAQQSAAAAPVPAAAPVASPVAPPATPPVAEAASPSTWQTSASSPSSTSEPVATLGSVPEAPIARERETAVSASPTPSISTALVSTPAAAPEPDTLSLSAVQASDAAPAPAATALSGAGQAVSGFFNNMGSSIGKMFGAGGASNGTEPGGQATQTASSPMMTSSTGPIYANTPAAGAEPAAWGDAVVKAPGAAAKNKIGASPAPAVKPQAASAGGVLLQVAAVRSREEADLVSTRLRGTPAIVSAGKQASIDEAVIGNMGTFYRVRLGPFANAAEPDKLCAVLKPEGYDCLVVTQ
jgi:tetratricopeptide (TPR) repeat protein